MCVYVYIYIKFGRSVGLAHTDLDRFESKIDHNRSVWSVETDQVSFLSSFCPPLEKYTFQLLSIFPNKFFWFMKFENLF